MITTLRDLLLLPILVAGLGLIAAGRATAQTFSNLHSFTIASDGGLPYAGVILSGGTLYGTTRFGGSPGNGTVYAVNTDGTGFTNLHGFISASDGANPHAELALAGDTLYGVTESGGGSGFGTVFAVRTNGTGFTNLHSFAAGSDGGGPLGGLIIAGAMLYGTAQFGGAGGQGTVFALNNDGTGFINLHNFAGSPGDGSNPQAGLVLAGGILYGTATSGGSAGQGTVFKLNANGTDYSTLRSFTGGSDGGNPKAALIVSGNTLYGTARDGGSLGNGTVFSLRTDGGGFTNLHSFTFDSGDPSYTNSDGIAPSGGLILSGSTLYGTAGGGGGSAKGTIFQINTNGTAFTTLHSFIAVSDGGNPRATLVLSANTLYGTASLGGSAANGAVFSLLMGSVSRPLLSITRSGAGVILTWPTNFTGFTLEANTNLNTANWAVVTTNIPATSGANNVVTNLISGRENYYRLRGL